jgi:hypothetical protein
VANDNTSFTVNKCFPAVPAVSSETCAATTQSLPILADSTNGTIFWNMDTSPATRSVITDFSSVASTLPGKFVRVSARYQQNGTRVAVRVWASSSFSKVFVGPEGHVVDVDRTNAAFTILNEDGTVSNPITVNGSTQFLFNHATIATGTGFLTSTPNNFVRGFKVHVNVDASTPLVADTIDIEIARYAGVISGPNNTGFTYTRTFSAPYASDGYNITLNYISPSTPNGENNSGAAINGFKWWYFALPTGTLDFGSTAATDFGSAVGGAVNYGSACTTSAFTTALGSQPVTGMSYANWNDPASPNTWSAFWAVLLPTPAPLSTASNANGASFGMTPIGTGCSAVTVDLSTTSGQASLVYQVNRSSTGVITVTPLDITQTSNLSTLDSALASGALVKAYGVPAATGHLKAYVLFYFSGTAPTQ